MKRKADIKNNGPETALHVVTAKALQIPVTLDENKQLFG